MSNQEKMFCGISLTIIPDTEHEYLMSTANVAEGFGVSEETVRSHKRNHSDELRPNKHWISGVENFNGGNLPVKTTYWTKRGIVRLGFLINSDRARIFRDWAEDLVLGKIEEIATVSPTSVESPNSPAEMFLHVAQQLLNHEQSLATLQIEHKSLTEKVEAIYNSGDQYNALLEEVRRIGAMEAEHTRQDASLCIRKLWGKVKVFAGGHAGQNYKSIKLDHIPSCLDYLKSYELQGWNSPQEEMPLPATPQELKNVPPPVVPANGDGKNGEMVFNHAQMKKLRIIKCLSQAEMAAILGVTSNTVFNWERGRKTPQLKTVVKIATLFGTNTAIFWV